MPSSGCIFLADLESHALTGTAIHNYSYTGTYRLPGYGSGVG